MARLQTHSHNLNTPSLVVVSPTDALMHIYKVSPPPSSPGGAGDSEEEDKDEEEEDEGYDNEVTRKSVLQNQILTYITSVRTSVSLLSKDSVKSKLAKSHAEGTDTSGVDSSRVNAVTLTFYSHAAYAASTPSPSGSIHKSNGSNGTGSYQAFKKQLTRLLKDSKDASLKRWQQTHLVTVNVGSKDDTSVSVVIDTSGDISATQATVGRTTRAKVDEDTSGGSIDSNSIGTVLSSISQRIYSAVYV